MPTPDDLRLSATLLQGAAEAWAADQVRTQDATSTALALQAQVAALQKKIADLEAATVPPVVPPTSPAPVKKGGYGLITRDHVVTEAGYRDDFSGWTMRLNWKDAIGQRGAPINSKLISDALVAAATHNQFLRIRPYCGVMAPDYVKAMGGPVAITDAYDGVSGTVARWWRRDVQAEYHWFMSELARVVDALPTVVEVEAALCSTIYAEVCNRDLADPTSQANLKAAGLTTDKDVAALHVMIDTHAELFPQTPTGVAHNPFQDVTNHRTDVAITKALIDYERQVLGDRSVLQNNSLDAKASYNPNGAPMQMYEYIASKGGKIAFQSQRTDRVNDMKGLLDFALELGAQAVEFSPGGWSAKLTQGLSTTYGPKLAANAH